jgi:Protein of unknown function (DUF2997)
MAEQKIIITIDENGRIVAETQGIKGEACLTELEALLGSSLEIASLKTTDEFQQETKIDNQQQLKSKKS